MSLVLEISPELEARIEELAQKNGMSVHDFALQSLREKVSSHNEPPTRQPRKAGSLKGLIHVPDDSDEPLELVPARKRRVFGAARGLIHVPDDFDQTPEEFAEYL